MCCSCVTRRNVSGVTEGCVDIPPVGKTALTWAFFMGTSSNVRYQVSLCIHRDILCNQWTPGHVYYNLGDISIDC